MARLLAACTASITMPRNPAFSSVRMACMDAPAGEHTSSFSWRNSKKKLMEERVNKNDAISLNKYVLLGYGVPPVDVCRSLKPSLQHPVCLC